MEWWLTHNQLSIDGVVTTDPNDFVIAEYGTVSVISLVPVVNPATPIANAGPDTVVADTDAKIPAVKIMAMNITPIASLFLNIPAVLDINLVPTRYA